MKEKKKSPIVNEEFIRERYKSGNPLTVEEIQDAALTVFNLQLISFFYIFKDFIITKLQEI